MKNNEDTYAPYLSSEDVPAQLRSTVCNEKGEVIYDAFVQAFSASTDVNLPRNSFIESSAAVVMACAIALHLNLTILCSEARGLRLAYSYT